ncbi:glycosyltransferase family 2 protein [uncultured Brachyspira sp.]|uniref:glycosyltransferase family 2 protein n=2 Tax=uncultured Brachyspira sp. TaxID=221953 RepID=UPI0025CD8602|nr:glycosyltransferase family 2 protein [uncultured Brachyspira sp.]
MYYDVSLIIVAYNEEKYLPILLDSIKKQKTDIKMEIILIDDASTDNTVNIAEQCNSTMGGGYIRILHNDRKSDVQYMRNTGLKEALGKVIIFFDTDVAISDTFIENMVRPIIDGKADATLCKTYAVLEAFYDVLPEKYSKSYVNFIKHCPRFMMKRFPVQFVPWIARWFKMMKDNKKIISIWNVPNRAHTTGIAVKTEIARKTGGWKVRIGDGDDAQYSNDVCDASNKVLWVGKCILFISRRRVFPTDNGWITDILFKPIKKWYRNKVRKKNDNDYTKSIR